MATGTPDRADPAWLRTLRRVVLIEREEVRATLWSFLAFFCVLAAYYVLRPIRDTMGIAGGVKNIPWLYLGTLGGTLATLPLWSWIVARWPRRVLVPVAYRFIAVLLVAFWAAFSLVPDGWRVGVARAFFIWLSVFNLVMVSVFWGFLLDLMGTARSRRLFGFIAGGGSTGALLGSLLTSQLAEEVGTPQLLLFSCVLFELAVQSLKRVRRACVEAFDPDEAAHAQGTSPAGGSGVRALWKLFESPYLRLISAWFFLYSLSATFAYQMQGSIVSKAITDEDARTRFFADVNLLVQALCFIAQTFLTARLIRLFGVGATLAVAPLVHLAGFLWLGASPLLLPFTAFEVARRTSEYGIASPARQVLFSVLRTDEKYRTKSFIDVGLLRTSDVATSFVYKGLHELFRLPAIALGVAPVGVLWAALSLLLGRRQRALAARKEAAAVFD